MKMDKFNVVELKNNVMALMKLMKREEESNRNTLIHLILLKDFQEKYMIIGGVGNLQNVYNRALPRVSLVQFYSRVAWVEIRLAGAIAGSHG